ncbi:MAG TPA: nucleotidyltransferase family protein [candidate division Zixibacteria bacterium]|nr:nucleotidyltransferase family protein [candidate division Zixibacteria bacterium]
MKKDRLEEVEQIMIKLKENLPFFEEKYKVKTLGVFGSYIRGEQKKKSDVDILVEFEKPIGLLDFVGMELELSEILGKKVDLVPKNALKPRIGKCILEVVKYI